MKEKSCLNEAEFALLQRASLCQALLFLLFCKNESRSLIVHINAISLKASNTHFFANARCGTFFSFPHFTCCQNSAAWQLVTATIASKKKKTCDEDTFGSRKTLKSSTQKERLHFNIADSCFFQRCSLKREHAVLSARSLS